MFKATVSGRLGSDPVMRYTPGGEPVTNITIAHNYKKGDRVDVEWVKVACWGEELAEKANQLAKGELIQAIGDVTFSYWTDDTGKPRKSCDLRADAIGKVALPPEGESEPSP
jgi:single-strand DNA-binding protein